MIRPATRLVLRLAGLLFLLPMVAFGLTVNPGHAAASGAAMVHLIVASDFAYVVLGTLATTTLVCGFRPVLAGCKFALWDDHSVPADSSRAGLRAPAEALALAARVMVGFGLLWSFTQALSALGVIEDVMNGLPQPGPARIASGIGGVIAVPLLSLLIGRVLLAGWANAASRAAGWPENRAFSRVSDVALLAYIVPVLFMISLAFWKYPTIR